MEITPARQLHFTETITRLLAVTFPMLEDKVKTTAPPLAMSLGSDDEEVAPALCQKVATRSIDAGTSLTVILYPGATHDFDDPADGRQDVKANRAAKKDATEKAVGVVEAEGFKGIPFLASSSRKFQKCGRCRDR